MKPTNPGLYWYRRFKHKYFNPWDVVRVFCNQEAKTLFFESIGTPRIKPVDETDDSDWGQEVKHETR